MDGWEPMLIADRLVNGCRMMCIRLVMSHIECV